VDKCGRGACLHAPSSRYLTALFIKQEEIIQTIAAELGIADSASPNSLGKEILARRINELITTDLHRLISILYRVDISEAKIRKLLADNPEENAGMLIATMMIERQEQKSKSRKENKKDGDIPENEAW